MAQVQESFYNLKTKIVELFAGNTVIAVEDIEDVMKALASLEGQLAVPKEPVPSIDEIDRMLYGHTDTLEIKPVDACVYGPTPTMQRELAEIRKLSSVRVDWACAYGRVAKAKEELAFLESQERTARYKLDSVTMILDK